MSGIIKKIYMKINIITDKLRKRGMGENFMPQVPVN
jgi:hypothetical protein